MIVKNIIDEDFTNYKTCSMFIGFPKCSFKCEKDCGMKFCQNSSLVLSPSIEIPVDVIVKRYMKNSLSSAIVCGGLEPLDSWEDLKELVSSLRQLTQDDIVIYTGYRQDECLDKIMWLKMFKNVVVKFGRFVPNQEKHYDAVLGIYLASDNQYAERIS